MSELNNRLISSVRNNQNDSRPDHLAILKTPLSVELLSVNVPSSLTHESWATIVHIDSKTVLYHPLPLWDGRSIRTIVDGLSYAIVLYRSHYRIPLPIPTSLEIFKFSDTFQLQWQLDLNSSTSDKTFKLQLNSHVKKRTNPTLRVGTEVPNFGLLNIMHKFFRIR